MGLNGLDNSGHRVGLLGLCSRGSLCGKLGLYLLIQGVVIGLCLGYLVLVVRRLRLEAVNLGLLVGLLLLEVALLLLELVGERLHLRNGGCICLRDLVEVVDVGRELLKGGRREDEVERA